VISYLKNPQEIYRRSFEIIAAEADFSTLPDSARVIATRVIHSSGMVEITSDLMITPDFAEAATVALAKARPILVDVEMVRHGIIQRFLPEGCHIICTLNDPLARERGLAEGITRTAAATALWRGQLEGAVVVIGNAPTALFALLEMIDKGAPKPAAIVAMPVGFVGAAESKAELISNPRGLPFATIRGRRGGSAMASSVINALTDVAS
jgi:precorrin-8X/cobalt-precorrin-8 methylmutase